MRRVADGSTRRPSTLVAYLILLFFISSSLFYSISFLLSIAHVSLSGDKITVKNKNKKNFEILRRRFSSVPFRVFQRPVVRRNNVCVCVVCVHFCVKEIECLCVCVCVCMYVCVCPIQVVKSVPARKVKKGKMHLHFEESQLRCDSVINSLSWMGRVPDEQPEVKKKTNIFLFLSSYAVDFVSN